MELTLKRFLKLLSSKTNPKHDTIEIGDICFDVIRKDIKNVYLRIHSPDGKVTISAPLRIDMKSIRSFAISNINWIKKQQSKIRCQERETHKEFINEENHYYLGKRYLLQVIDHDAPATITIKHDTMEMHVRPNISLMMREKILNEWYRKKLKEIIPGITAQYETIMKVTVNEFGVKKMKTRWGTCSIVHKRIWLNLELAKRPKEHLEYVVVHEMAHLLERRHNKRFATIMDKFLPKWRLYKKELNRIPFHDENHSDQC